MYIKRIQVEEGFLNGLDLEFCKGLNVLIGARGTGKTSIIELLRFCLGANNFTERYKTATHEHASEVLGSGLVTVTLDNEGDEIQVSRSLSDDAPRFNIPFNPPIVFSQKEIEYVGLEASGRLRIIDRFREDKEDQSDQIALVSEIKSLTVEIKSISDEISGITANIESLNDFPTKLTEAKEEHESMLKLVTDSKIQQASFQVASAELSKAAVRKTLYKDTTQSLLSFRQRLESALSSGPHIEPWPTSAGDEDLLQEIRDIPDQLRIRLTDTLALIDDKIAVVQKLELENDDRRAKIEDKARKIRQELEEIQEGAGAVARKVTELEERVGQLTALRSSLDSKALFLEDVNKRRGSLLSKLDKFYEKRFTSRLAVVEKLNSDLNPSIEIIIERSAGHVNYIAAIGEALRGTGLHYNQHSITIANSMRPREFSEAVERNDVNLVSKRTGIRQDITEKICGEIRTTGVKEIITAELQDSVKMFLLDGTAEKSTEQLSMGQRCTVILPIVMSFDGRPLIIDQPEDHLDNAFIVETLVGAIQKRKLTGQLILATHNPNIPVLGEADLVIHLDSNGKRGFLKRKGGLYDLAIVNSITSLMEGGYKAFQRRSAFYIDRYEDSK